MQVEGLSYYSATHDVIAWPEADEGAFRVLASFSTHADALTYAKAHTEALCVRPPAQALRDAIAYTSYLLALANYTFGDPPTPPRATY